MMGFRVQLIAVTGKHPRTIQRDFGVAPTGDYEEIAESPVVGSNLPNGAYLLYINEEENIVPDDAVYIRLSKGGSLIACYVNETVMQSYACAWSNGVELWSVLHDAELGVEHLETKGVLPPDLPAIRDRLFAQQHENEVHDVDFIFDIPIELFVASGGIRYDHDIPGADPEPWEILEKQE